MWVQIIGLNDNFIVASSHVIPGLITKFLSAKKNKKNVKICGTGKPIRKFIHVNDLASAIFTVLNAKSSILRKICNKYL